MAGAAAGLPAFELLAARPAHARHRRGPGYGPLVEAGPELALPRGFRYRVLSAEGDMMDDGYPVPSAFDGMAAFALPNGDVRLIRNHELRESARRMRPRVAPPGVLTDEALVNPLIAGDPIHGRFKGYFGPRAFAYDQWSAGGTTSLDVERGHRRVVNQHWSLVGTNGNCSGGATPWGSWLSCEEDLTSAAPGRNEKNHGYVFEVPIDTRPGAPAAPVPIPQLGRFNHEGAVVDPATSIIYLTEDGADTSDPAQGGSGLYRFVPDAPITAAGQLAGLPPFTGPQSGRLQMLAVNGRAQFRTQTTKSRQTTDRSFPVTWVDVPTPDAPPSGPDRVFAQGWSRGGAMFRRLEGIALGGGKIYFVSTNGGDAGFGQVWSFDPVAQQLALVYEPPLGHGVTEILEAPDNVVVSPRGGLVLCEDGAGVQMLRGLSADGTEIFEFARNLHSAFEFAGACYSPDGRTLFVNIYGTSTMRLNVTPDLDAVYLTGSDAGFTGLTLAIWGPFESRRGLL